MKELGTPLYNLQHSIIIHYHLGILQKIMVFNSPHIKAQVSGFFLFLFCFRLSVWGVVLTLFSTTLTNFNKLGKKESLCERFRFSTNAVFGKKVFIFWSIIYVQQVQIHDFRISVVGLIPIGHKMFIYKYNFTDFFFQSST